MFDKITIFSNLQDSKCLFTIILVMTSNDSTLSLNNSNSKFQQSMMEYYTRTHRLSNPKNIFNSI